MKLATALLAALALGLAAVPAGAAEPIEGKQFTRLQMPQPTEPNGKVEVIEFFWYGCPHCAEFEPLLQAWKKQLPADVSFRKVPAIFRDSWVPGARLFYTLEALGLLDKLNDAVFVALVKQRINLNDELVLLDWVAQQGVDRRAFAAAYHSAAVTDQVRKAAEMTQEYGFGGVPVLIVGGKYMPSLEVGTYAEMLRIVDALIARNRAELCRPGPTKTC
jgi:thiol:disulfide interchange protein DsbA